MMWFNEQHDISSYSQVSALKMFFCFQEIGWRNDALKMVFLVTDQNYHLAGDGKVSCICMYVCKAA